jgi:hypothetical protein
MMAKIAHQDDEMKQYCSLASIDPAKIQPYQHQHQHHPSSIIHHLESRIKPKKFQKRTKRKMRLLDSSYTIVGLVVALPVSLVGAFAPLLAVPTTARTTSVVSSSTRPPLSSSAAAAAPSSSCCLLFMAPPPTPGVSDNEELTVDDIALDAEERMEKSVDSVRTMLTSIRTGRASASMLDRVKANYYGTCLVYMYSISKSTSR